MSYEKEIEKTVKEALSDKTAIITGASSGIGRATALTLSQAGAAVVIHARRKDRLDKLASEIANQGGKSLVVVGDASIQADIDLLLNRALAWNEGGCKYDIVVVNAGRGLAGGILSSDESQWQELYHVNVLGAAHLMRRAGQYMVQRKSGDIVVIGACGSYVELNPVRARIAEDPKEYRWSSYNAYAYGRADRITDGHSVYKELSENEYERRKRYRDYVKGMIRDKKAMKGEMNRRAVYGSEAFVEKMLKEHKAEAVIRPQGRPVKSESNNN